MNVNRAADFLYTCLRSLTLAGSLAPEVSWKHIDSNDGQGLLDILYKLCRERPPNHYIYAEHLLVDMMLELPQPWDTSTIRAPQPKLYWQLRFVVHVSSSTRSD